MTSVWNISDILKSFLDDVDAKLGFDESARSEIEIYAQKAQNHLIVLHVPLILPRYMIWTTFISTMKSDPRHGFSYDIKI